MGMSRNEDILQAMVDGTDSSELPKPQSREEKLLHAILDKLNTGGGGSGGGLSIHYCTDGEYNQITGVPTIENPSETTFYLVPTGKGDNNLYDEWVYADGKWEHFGSGTSQADPYDGTYYIDPDTDQSIPIRGIITNPKAGQTLIFDSETGKWVNAEAANTYTFSEGETDGAFKVTSSDGTEQTVTVHGLLPFCFSGSEDDTIFDSGSIDD